MRYPALIALAVSLAVALSVSQGVAWTSYEDGLHRGERDGKVIYVYFYSRNCPYCALMEDTFADPSVEQLLNSRFVAVRVDVEERPDLASLYTVLGTPMHVFLCPNGSLILSLIHI